jgi:hypothetical protein
MLRHAIIDASVIAFGSRWAYILSHAPLARQHCQVKRAKVAPSWPISQRRASLSRSQPVFSGDVSQARFKVVAHFLFQHDLRMMP